MTFFKEKIGTRTKIKILIFGHILLVCWTLYSGLSHWGSCNNGGAETLLKAPAWVITIE